LIIGMWYEKDNLLWFVLVSENRTYLYVVCSSTPT